MTGENAAVQFNVFGKTLNVSPGRVEFNRLRSRFVALAHEQEFLAQESIEQYVDDPEPLLKDGWTWAVPYFSKAADLAVEELAQKGCFDLDASTYLNGVFDRSPWERCCKECFAEYESIVAAEKQREVERDEQTDEASEAWMGGGFGVGNAIKGAVQAGILNFATAAISEGINAIGRNRTQKANAEKIREVFSRRRMEIVRGVFSAIAEGANALVKCLDERGVKIEDVVSSSDVEKSERILNNLKDGKIPSDRIEDAKFGILQSNPYCREFYEYEYVTRGDPSRELEQVATYFGVSFENKKRDAFLSRLGECRFETEEAALAYRRKAVALANELNYDGSATLAEIDMKLVEMDREAKTAGGRLFEDRETAAKQRELCEIESTLDLSSEKSAMEGERMLMEKVAEFGVDFSWRLTRVRDALKKFDVEARTVNGQIFDSREIASRQRQLHEYERVLDVSTEAAARASRDALMAKIAELGVDGEWVVERVNVAISRFEHEARIAFGQRYLSRDAALDAKGNSERFAEGIVTVVANCNHKSFLSGVGITPKKSAGAVQHLGVHPSERILALIDTTVFGSVKTGLALTSIGLRWKNPTVPTSRNFISWNELALSARLPSTNGRIIDLGDGMMFENCGFVTVPQEKLLQVLQRVCGFCREATFLK